MSDFLYSSAPQPPGRLGAILERRMAALRPRIEERHGEFGTLAWSSLPFLPPMVRETATGLSVLAGEPLRSDAGDAAAPSPAELDGPFALLELEGTSGRVVTDLLGAIPLFHAPGGGGLVVGTHVDAVAEAAGLAGAFDPVAAADFLAHGSIVYPHTLYEGVQQVAPAADWRIERGRWTQRSEYWLPHERNPYGSLREAADELRAALVADVARALAGLDRAGMLLSAGEDSRVVLGAVPRDVRIEAVTFADWDNREVAIARRVAQAYGASFEVGVRGFSHILDSLEPAALFVGSQHQFVDVHGWGLHEALGLDRMPLVLGGYSSDSLLKAYHSPTKLRRSQPQKKHARETDPLPPARALGVRPELLEAARERREARRAVLREIRPETATEWMRIWPFSGRATAAAYLGQRRLFHSHEPFMSGAIVRLAAAVPLAWKLDRRLFRAAMRPLLRRSRHVPHARNMFPYYGLPANVVLGAGLAVGRFARDAVAGRLGRHQGPWPDRHALVRSDLFTGMLRRHPIERSRAHAIFEGETPEAIERSVRRWGPKRQLMMLQLAYLTQERDAG